LRAPMHRRFVELGSVAVTSMVVASGMPMAVADLPTVIHNLTVWIVGILAGVATLFLTYAGARYLTAGGDPGEIEKAKSAFKSALLGYALAVLAPVVLIALKSILEG
jgi:type IV secretion system pilin